MEKRKNHESEKSVFLILHNIRSAHNVGSIFRTADALRVNKIFLTGYTPAPMDKFGRSVKEIEKTALGSEKNISWEKTNFSKCFNQLKKDEFHFVAIEQDKKSIDYRKVKIKKKTVFLLGNEVRGLDKKILKKCDIVAEIPMFGKKESLNVSVATAVALFRIINP